MFLVGTSCGVNMAYRIILLAFLVSILAKPLQEQVAKNTDYDYKDKDDDDPEQINGPEEIRKTEDTISVPVNIKGPKIKELKVKRDREEITTTQKPVAKYEVTELVIDVPDISTRRVPILTNFTLTRPLNFAGVPKDKTDNTDVNIKDEGDEVINSIFIYDRPKNTKDNGDQNVEGNDDKFDVNKDENNYFSYFHIKDSFEEEFDKEFGSDEDDIDNLRTKEESNSTKGFKFKDHFHNFRKNIVNEFKSVVNKHKDDIHDSLRKIVNGPISFFSKLHRKSSDLARKLHNVVSRHKVHDKEDDVGYHGDDHNYSNDC